MLGALERVFDLSLNTKCLRYGRRYGADPRENLLTFDKRVEQEEARKKAESQTLEVRYACVVCRGPTRGTHGKHG